MQELEDRLWVAEAKEEIRYKLCMYARGDDRQDAAIGKPVYAEDSYVDFGTSPEFGEVFKGSGRSGPNIARTRSIRALRLMAVTTRTRCTTSLLP